MKKRFQNRIICNIEIVIKSDTKDDIINSAQQSKKLNEYRGVKQNIQNKLVQIMDEQKGYIKVTNIIIKEGGTLILTVGHLMHELVSTKDEINIQYQNKTQIILNALQNEIFRDLPYPFIECNINVHQLKHEGRNTKIEDKPSLSAKPNIQLQNYNSVHSQAQTPTITYTPQSPNDINIKAFPLTPVNSNPDNMSSFKSLSNIDDTPGGIHDDIEGEGMNTTGLDIINDDINNEKTHFENEYDSDN